MDESQPQAIAATLDPAAIYERFRTPVLRFALQRLRNRDDAEDLMQETLRRVVEAIDENRIREPDALSGFVYQTAKHVYFKWLRKRGNEERAMTKYADAGDGGPKDEPLTTALQEERRDRVKAAIGKLEADDRNLLERLYGQGMKPRDIARMMGMTPGAVRVKKHRALKRLGDKLGDETFWPFEELNQ